VVRTDPPHPPANSARLQQRPHQVKDYLAFHNRIVAIDDWV